MPEIGEVKRGYQIGIRSGAKFIWQSCELCGKERWVQLLKDMPVNTICNSCSQLKRKRGGRFKDRYGYIIIKLQPNDFFYPMVDGRGYVKEHRLVVAKALGRCLQPWEIVHHKDGIRDHNDDDNLQLTLTPNHNQITILENRISWLEKRVTLLEAENVRLNEITEARVWVDHPRG